jgi:hypothetical protein
MRVHGEAASRADIERLHREPAAIEARAAQGFPGDQLEEAGDGVSQ